MPAADSNSEPRSVDIADSTLDSIISSSDSESVHDGAFGRRGSMRSLKSWSSAESTIDKDDAASLTYRRSPYAPHELYRHALGETITQNAGSSNFWPGLEDYSSHAQDFGKSFGLEGSLPSWSQPPPLGFGPPRAQQLALLLPPTGGAFVIRQATPDIFEDCLEPERSASPLRPDVPPDTLRLRVAAASGLRPPKGAAVRAVLRLPIPRDR